MTLPAFPTSAAGPMPRIAPQLAVVIPVKRFSEAKQRLAGVLARDARAAFAHAMYVDVLDAVTQAVASTDVFVVTADAVAARLAVARGCNVVVDTACAGTREALAQGVAHVEAAGYRTMLALPADLPLLEPADVLEIVGAHPTPSGVTLVASADGRGTNALCCSPPAAVRLQHGDDSFRLHRAAARAAGHRVVVLELARIALDIDTADDLSAFARHRSATRSGALLPAWFSGRCDDVATPRPASPPARVAAERMPEEISR